MGRIGGGNGRRKGRDGKLSQAGKKLIHQLINKKQETEKRKDNDLFLKLVTLQTHEFLCPYHICTFAHFPHFRFIKGKHT